jgi:hypothetical protein
MRARRLPTALVFVAIAVAAAARPVRTEQTFGQSGDSSNLDGLLAHVEQRVIEYLARARSIVCEETTRIDQLDESFSNNFGLHRSVVSELRVAWDAAVDGDVPDATIHREILTINGRPPRENDDRDCFDPKPISPEPLAMFLAAQRSSYVFTVAGAKKIDGRQTVVLDYKPTAPPGKPNAAFTDHCVSIDLPHWSHGRVFVDAATFDIVRFDESITRRFEVDVPFERRADFGEMLTGTGVTSSTHFKQVTFHDPDETVLLPDSIETLQTLRRRTRIAQTFKNYRRFMTGARLVKDPR